MTLQELSRYYKLQRRLGKNREILVSLEEAVHPGAQLLTGMPHAPGAKDKVGDLAVEIADTRSRIQALEKESHQAEREISAYIDTIQDDQTRMIFRLRFLRCLTWSEVAALIGGRNTANSVRAICYPVRCVDGLAGHRIRPGGHRLRRQRR